MEYTVNYKKGIFNKKTTIKGVGKISGNPDRMIFFIDPGNIPPKKAENYINIVKANYEHEKNLGNETKEKDLFILRKGTPSEAKTIYSDFVKFYDKEHNLLASFNKKNIISIEKTLTNFL